MHSLIPIPFNTGRILDPIHRIAFESEFDFKVPFDVLIAYDGWSGGAVDGWLVFDLPQCKHLAISKFFVFGTPEENGDEFEEFASTIYYKCNDKDIMPLAKVVGSVCPSEANNYFNCESLLVFRRKGGPEVYLKAQGELINVADSLSSLLQNCTFWFQYQPPNA